ncbi:mitochondrial F1F0 ATP synthase-like protein subunit Atp18 [Mollisia scopiformis]|uniref:Mitochondrial F1F0 ATP synthase-like protein subunit Atp18 n=1 Tax=Mollisia scopiformis TaxID=149040 RepID=A0A194X0E9_MOLSC|nr:mitochondrial F1F0 ATP synthase-like protein subunit Atp18 [Mollisia scopiformis]KUJ13670.1 mitochondrial F1F0 ATP synthase-like protein subunit Atp18 [Mollisia scopiformis]
MSLLGKKFPAPVAKPMAPFYIAGLVILYGVNSAATAMMASDEFKNDPRNPNAKTAKPADKH